MAILAKKYFTDEVAAFAHLERLLWADGVVCPHCGTVGRAGKLNGIKGKNGKVRPGLWKCYSKECRKQFTVRVGTVFEASHIPLHKMLQAVYLLCSSKKGIIEPPTPPSLGGRLQVGVVSGTPNSRSDAGRHCSPPWAAAAKL